MEPMQLGIMTSLVDQNAIELFLGVLNAVELNKIKKVKIAFVFTDRPENFRANPDLINELARRRIPLVSEPSNYLRHLIQSGSPWEIAGERRYFDRKVLKLINSTAKPSLVILIGYMLQTTGWLCGRLSMINLHPDVPGRFRGKWKDIVKRIIKEKVLSAGAMVHVVSRKLDRGHPITFTQISLDSFEYKELWDNPKKANWLAKKIRDDQYKRELPLIILTLKFLANGTIYFSKGEVCATERLRRGLKDGFDLTDQVEKWLTCELEKQEE